MNLQPDINYRLLNSSANGAKDNREVKCLRLLPLVGYLKAEYISLLVRKTLLCLEVQWVLCGNCSMLEEGKNVVQVLLTRELFDIGHQLVFWNAQQRVLNPELGSTV